MLWHVVAFFSLNFGRAQLCDPDAGLNLSLEVCGVSNASTFWFENSWNPWNEKDHFGSSSACQRNITKLVAMPRPAKMRRRTPLDGMSDEGAAAFNQFKEDACLRIFYVCAILIHTNPYYREPHVGQHFGIDVLYNNYNLSFSLSALCHLPATAGLTFHIPLRSCTACSQGFEEQHWFEVSRRWDWVFSCVVRWEGWHHLPRDHCCQQRARWNLYPMPQDVQVP